jgi:hypothetical protein
MSGGQSPAGASMGPPSSERAQHSRARGLAAWSVVALLLSPFAISTFGIGAALAIGLVVVSAVLQARGFDARRPMAAGIVALVINLSSAGACGWLVLRTAEVTGREAVRQNTVERRFDRAFDNATAPPENTSTSTGDAGIPVDADSTSQPQEPR